MALGGMSRPLETRRRRKMTKLRNMVGIAFVAMSLLTGFAATSASAQEASICQVDPAVCYNWQYQETLMYYSR
jgi:hypothetical protein